MSAGERVQVRSRFGKIRPTTNSETQTALEVVILRLENHSLKAAHRVMSDEPNPLAMRQVIPDALANLSRVCFC